jgi:hypothetical protein
MFLLAPFCLHILIILHGLSEDGEGSFDDDFDKIDNSVSFTDLMIHFSLVSSSNLVPYASSLISIPHISHKKLPS